MEGLLLFILGLFILAAVFRLPFFVYILYVFFGLYLLSRVWVDRSAKALACRRDYLPRAFHGERIPVKLEVRNKGWLPLPYVRLHESLPVRLISPNFQRAVVSFLPKEKVTLDYELEGRRRGYYPLGPLTIHTGDLFGIRSVELQIPSDDHLTVYPRIIPLPELGLPAQTPMGTLATQQRIYEDPSRIIGVRDYQIGDSLRRMHWKASAAAGKLQVKRLEPAISIEAQIFLNLDAAAYTQGRVHDATELGIITAASIAHALVSKRQTVGLCTNGSDPLAEDHRYITLPPRKGTGHLVNILEALARVGTSEGHSFGDLLQQASMHLSWGGTAVVITAHADEELFSQLLMMKRNGFHIVLIVTDAREPFAAVRERARAVGIVAYEVWQERDLDVWRAR
ncbi:MAG: DUF58 domain-containing protein [Anaerolineae bacterium]|jgi:uncharacterized protein (DUF58 family)